MVATHQSHSRIAEDEKEELQKWREYINERVRKADEANLGKDGGGKADVRVVDISSFCDSNCRDEDKRQRCVLDVAEACRNSGMFMITGHGINEMLSTKAFAEFSKFFSQEEHVKQSVAASDERHGWIQKASADRVYNRGDVKDELRENFCFTSSNCKFKPNAFPSDSPAFEYCAMEFYEHLERLEHVLNVILARALCNVKGLSYITDSYITDEILGDTCKGLCCINYYLNGEKSRENRNPKHFGAHTDWSLYTIVIMNAAGLEVIENDTWKQVSILENEVTVVINVADFLQRWSNNVFVSPIHRVQIQPSRTCSEARISLAYFVGGCVDPEDCRKIPVICSDGENEHFRPVGMKDYLDRNYSLTQGIS